MQATEIIVNGHANVSQQPDCIRLQIRLKSEALEYAATIENLNKAVKSTLNGLSSVGIDEEPQTTIYSIEENWEHPYDDDKRKFVGFKGEQSMSVRMPLNMEMLNLVLKLLSSQASKPSVRSYFEVRDLSGLQAEARHKAIESASLAAQDIANQLGLILKGVKSVEYGMPTNTPSSVLSIDHDDGMDDSQVKASLSPIINPAAVKGSDDISITWLASL
jgi:uncharacterized protein YggE